MARGTLRQVLDAYFRNPGHDEKFTTAGETRWYVRESDDARLLERKGEVVFFIPAAGRAITTARTIPRFSGLAAYRESSSLFCVREREANRPVISLYPRVVNDLGTKVYSQLMVQAGEDGTHD